MHIKTRYKQILMPLLLVVVMVAGLAGCSTVTPAVDPTVTPKVTTPAVTPEVIPAAEPAVTTPVVEPDVTPADEPSQVLTRSEAPEKYKWDLTEFYENREAFEDNVALVKEEYLPALAAYQGKLTDAESLRAFFEMETEAGIILDNVYVYAYLMSDLDQTASEATEMADIASGLYAEYGSAIAFCEPEILALDEATLSSLLNEPSLATYRYYLQTLLDRREHVLSDKEEQILAAMSEITSAPEDIFSKAQYADFTYPTITNKDGEEIELDWTAYDAIMEDPDREYRKTAYEAMWGAYKKINHTMAATYTAKVKADAALAEIRGYDSALEAALASEHIPRSIYDNLIEATHDNLDYLHQYYGLCQRTLELEELHSYDMGLPLVEDYDMEIPYDEAVATVAAALAPLGEEYVADFIEGINSRWVDVYPDDHKYTGCYEWETYTSHPYILMNYDNSLDGALALAHEMGHAMNSLYSNRTQDYCNAYYPIFTAEVASITNEMLLMDYLIENAATDDEKLYLLLQHIDNINGAFYTQVMFSEFEQTVHAKAEAGEPLSADVLNNTFLGLIGEYRGPDYTVDEAGGVGWNQVPHFYSEFYVYKYATSIAAARQLSDNILAGKEGALESYLEFLAAGGSDYPVEVLKNAGVDMNSPEPVDNLLAYFGELVAEADRLLQPRKSAE